MIENERGPAVVFAIDEPVAGGVGTEEMPAFVEGGGEAVAPPRFVQGNRAADMDHAEADGGLAVVKAEPEEPVLPVVEHGDFAVFARAVLFPDFIPVNPRMPLTHGLFRRRSDPHPES